MRELIKTTRDLLNLTLTPEQVTAFEQYARYLLEWNEQINLTAITDPEQIEMRHFTDSLTCLMAMRPLSSGLRVIDIGTGAGFPGLPLKIACPSIDLTLVESVGKKVDFLAFVVERLGLGQVTLINSRAETIGQAKQHRENYHVVLARAVANMPTLVEYLLPLCRVGGRVIAQKGENAHQETALAQEAIQVLGGKLNRIHQFELPGVVETHHLVVLDKIAATPPKYPRRPGMPAKRPIT